MSGRVQELSVALVQGLGQVLVLGLELELRMGSVRVRVLMLGRVPVRERVLGRVLGSARVTERVPVRLRLRVPGRVGVRLLVLVLMMLFASVSIGPVSSVSRSVTSRRGRRRLFVWTSGVS